MYYSIFCWIAIDFVSFFFLKSVLICLILGELDPERMGSGIQYGDALRRMHRQEKLQPRVTRSDCPC